MRLRIADHAAQGGEDNKEKSVMSAGEKSCFEVSVPHPWVKA
jgi:hypothetical protein